MSKTVPSALLAHYQSGSTTLARCIKITRNDGAVLGYTSASQPLRVAGVLYRALTLVEQSDVASSAGMATDNAELRVAPDDAGTVTRADILTGLWDNAAWELFELNYTDVSMGVNVIKSGTLGEHTLNRGEFVFELRGLMQALQQPVGDVTSTTCRYRLGDARCTKSLTAFTYAGSVVSSSSGSRQVVNASGRAEAADWFAQGELTFTTGLNAGYRRKVRTSAPGVITLAEALPFDIAVGDVFTAIAGCQKRHLTDCRDKFSNILNFGGEPHLPGIDELTASPTVSV